MQALKSRIPTNKVLANICVYGAIASISAVMYMRWKMQDRIRNADFYKLAFTSLRHHKGAVSLLGEPIKENGFDLSNEKNCCDAHTAQFEVKVRGPKDNGTVYFLASRDEDQGWLLDRLELETKLHPNRRFILSKRKLKGEHCDPKNLEENIKVAVQQECTQQTSHVSNLEEKREKRNLEPLELQK